MAWSERDDWQIECWSTVGANAELRNDFRDWHADVPVMIDRHVRLRGGNGRLYNDDAARLRFAAVLQRPSNGTAGWPGACP
jgi:hypothetical protein